MHQIAAYCALLGMQPMMFDDSQPGENDTGVRIRFHVQDNEKHLYCLFIDNEARWGRSAGGLLARYSPIAWSDIPNEHLDGLTVKRINDFLEDD